jgi:hypothetical protein
MGCKTNNRYFCKALFGSVITPLSFKMVFDLQPILPCSYADVIYKALSKEELQLRHEVQQKYWLKNESIRPG